MRKIFISYRRNDTDMVAGRLAADLRNHFGEETVFRDKESIAVGADWEEEIRSAIGPEGAVLVLIGKNWLETDAEGLRRIDDPEDAHRGEVAAALNLGCLVIPILVSQAEMPRKESLPEEIRSLTRFNALKLRDDEWSGFDFPRLTRELENNGFKPKVKPAALDLGRLSAVKWKDEALAGVDLVRQASELVKQGLKPDSKPVPQQAPEPPASAATAATRPAWSRKLIASLVLGSIAFLGFGEQEDLDTLLGILFFALIGLGLGVFGWWDARRGRVRSTGVGIFAMSLNGLCVLAAIGLFPEYLSRDLESLSDSLAQISDQLTSGQMNASTAPAPMTAVPAISSPTSPSSALPANNAISAVPGLDGMWGDSLGRTHVLQQNGNHLTLRDISPNSPLHGMILSGTVHGHQVTLSGTVPGEGPVSLHLQLTPDGSSMNGVLMESSGMQMPYAFFRMPE